MRPFTARIVYCVCLCTLAACAALPEPTAAAGGGASTPASTASTPAGIAAELALAMSRQAELRQVYGPAHPETTKAAAAVASLRENGLLIDPQTFERDLIEALSYQLANARQDMALLSTRYGPAHPEFKKADGLVLALTVAINEEVRRVKAAS